MEKCRYFLKGAVENFRLIQIKMAENMNNSLKEKHEKDEYFCFL